MHQPFICNEKDITQGPAEVLMGTVNSAFSILDMVPIGTISPEGVKWTPTMDPFAHQDANGGLIENEIVSYGAKLSFEILELNKRAVELQYASGNWTSAIAGTDNIGPLQKVVLFGNGYSPVANYRNITISAASDGGATPVSYAPSTDIVYGGNGLAGDNDGTIRRSANSDIPSSALGTTIYVTGTATSNAKNIFSRTYDSFLDYIPLMIVRKQKHGNVYTCKLWKCQITPGTIDRMMKAKEKCSCKFEFDVLRDRTQLDLYEETFELSA